MKISSNKKSIGKMIALAAATITAAMTFSFGLAACVEDDKPEYTVEFKSAEHVEYSVNGYEDVKTKGSITVTEGTTVTFSVVLEENYTLGEVKANSDVLYAVSNFYYSFTVAENTEVSVSGVVEAPVVLKGQGTSKEPYLISTVRELNYVANQVNSANPNFILAYYKLDADIDCGDANLDVIGNGLTESSFFGGNFDGAGHTISNYTIETTDYSYAGLFGIVQQYVTQGAE
ncbi:MAG: hypothetical protein K2K80_08365, partial [Clostridia bacterium]|nr:hypothetical protein [Clostridia bacterium]